MDSRLKMSGMTRAERSMIEDVVNEEEERCRIARKTYEGTVPYSSPNIFTMCQALAER
jgi:hypothetical protein